MVCVVDKKVLNEVYPSCVLDYGKPEDCSMAEGKTTRDQCEFWVDEKKAVCQCCGQPIQF